MVDSICENFHIPAGVHPTAPGRDKTITQFPAGKVGVYSRLFDYCGYRIPFTKFFMAVLKYFRIHISQLSPFGEAQVSHFEVLTRVLDLAPSVSVFRAFYTRTYSDGLFSFAKRSNAAPSCFLKPPDSIKNWTDHFFCFDSIAFPISVPLYKGGVLEKDSAPHLTARQEEIVKLLESHKAHFRRYPECFLCLVGLSPYYSFDENSYPAFEYSDGTGRCYFLLVLVRAMEVQKGVDQVKLLESTKHCFMPLVIPAAGGSSSATAEEVPAPTEGGQEDVAVEDANLELTDLDEQIQEEEVVKEQPEKVKRKRLVNSSTLVIPVTTTAVATTSTRAAVTSKAATDRWYVPKWNITNDSLLDDAFSCRTLVEGIAPPAFFSGLRTMDCDQLYTEFNVGAARRICLGSEVRARAEHELELKEKLKAKYAACGKLLEEKDLEIVRLKSQLAKKKAKAVEAVRLRDQVSSLSEEKSALTAEVSALKVTITQKDHDISLLDSRATHLSFTLDDAKAACTEAGIKITSLMSERDRLTSEVSSLHAGFQDFKEKIEAQQEEQAQELYNRVGKLEAHVMDVSGRLEGGFYPAYLTTLAGRRWLLTHGVQLALIKCLKSPEYQGIMGHALGWAVDFGMQEGLAAGHEHGTAGRDLFAVEAYNSEAAKEHYVSAMEALEGIGFPLVDLLRSKKDTGMDEVLDCFLLDGPLAGLPKALEQLTVPIHHTGDKTVVRETSLSFALMNVHTRAEGAKKHVAALRKLMIDIVSDPLSSQTWVGEASTSAAPLFVEDYDEEDTDEALGSVIAIPELEVHRF
ncbi:hypothetical protein Tco_0523613, partial [Tanacetum coccineum]